MRKLILLVIILVLVFIWGNSMLSVETSSQESEWVRGILTPLFDALAAFGVTADPSRLVRKMAHFGEYMILGMLMCLLLTRKDWRPRFFAAVFACAVTATVDECIQMFSDGRGPGVGDVLLDVSGAVTGIGIAMLVIAFVMHRNARKAKDG